MAPPKRTERREQILETARSIAVKRGLAGMTFEAIADALGVTKQAVIYWFPSKTDLVAALASAALQAEADAVGAALGREKDDDRAAIRAALQACLRHHDRQLEAFRSVYVLSQLGGASLPRERRPEHIYAITSRLYGALEERLRRIVPAGVDARELAVALHTATLGFATMNGVMRASDDAMKAPLSRYLDTLIDAVLDGAVRPGRRRR